MNMRSKAKKNNIDNIFVVILVAAVSTVMWGCTVTVPHRIISAGPSTYIASSGGGVYTFESGAVRESV